ncbi:MAG TPA: gamma-glutamyltransferase [Bacteroidetes bacterium]|nr:gamma-glutamyltransferase [Bacteroidota bacterium]
MPHRLLRAALALVVAVASVSCQAQISATPPPVRAQNGMVVAAEENAAQAGVEVMRAGGNAVDAAVATGFALAVTYPIAGNIGGGGFMVIRFPDGTATTFDYRETAPALATRDMFLDSTGTYMPDVARRGALASGTPGSVAGLLLAHERYGRLPLAEVIAPAIRLAEGYALSREQADRFNAYRDRLQVFESTARYFAPADSFAAGQTFRQRDLARVLERIRDRGRDGFYRGETADLLVAQMEASGGLISHEDLAAYQAVEREPLYGSYRGHRVISMPPPSSGGVALIQLLRSVEPYDLGAMGLNSSASIHLMGEAMRRVYADRAEWLGDPDFTPVPVESLTATDYVRQRMADVNPYRADTSRAVTYGNPLAGESMETTHYSVVDADGLAVSTTTTINGGYGSYLVVDGAGFFLNNEMDDFAAAPGVPNMFGLLGSEANAVAPGKRMLSSMTPTIVEDPDGELFLVIGSPGGARIITTVFQVITNVIDHGLDIQAAVSAPRIHHQWFPDVMYAERHALSEDTERALRQRGWSVREGGRWSRADGIVVSVETAETADDPSGLTDRQTVVRRRTLLGGADPRGQDVAVGY